MTKTTAGGHPAKMLLAEILAIVNRHQGCNQRTPPGWRTRPLVRGRATRGPSPPRPAPR